MASSLKPLAHLVLKMVRVFADFGVSARSVIICVTGLVLVVGAFIVGLVSVAQAALLVLMWASMAFLLLPTRHLIMERCGRLRRLPFEDRRAASLFAAKQRAIFAQAGLVGVRDGASSDGGNDSSKRKTVEHYPTLSKPNAAPYGLCFDVLLPSFLGIMATKAVKASDVIDGHISYLLRRVAPEVKTTVEAVSGSKVRLEIRLRDEFCTTIRPEDLG